MTRPIPVSLGLGVLCVWASLTACSPTPGTPTGAVRTPVDFAFACEGAGQTQLPSLDERATSLDDARLCPDITLSDGRTVEGHGVGALLSSSPPGVILLQTNPHSSGGRRVLDSESATPGYTRIPVGEAPIRIVTAPDGSSFYAVSAGESSITRIVVESIQGPEGILFTTDEIPLPGAPSDALIVGDQLVVSAAHETALWFLDIATTPSNPALETLEVPGRVATINHVNGELILTWIDRPVLSRLTVEGAWIERGLVPACQDGLDQDKDGLIDAADPDCMDPEDDDESGTQEERLADDLDAGGQGFAGASPCEDGLDNDGDGLTDGDDSACAGGLDRGEWVANCADGIDNDGDGLTDTADTACYGPLDRSEGQLPATGPHRAVVVNAGEAGVFVYALSPGRHAVQVFDAAAGLEPVDVYDRDDIEIPELRHSPYAQDSTADPTVLPAIRVTGKPGLAFAGQRSSRLPSVGGIGLTAQRLRGEIWDHIIAPASGESRAALDFDISGAYRPAGCDPDRTDQCVQPLGDDDTYYVYMSRMDGRLQMIEAVRRGVPVHQMAQTHTDLELRGTAADRPSLSLRGKRVALGNNLPDGYAFLGPLLQESLAEKVTDESPATYRRYGLWPATDPELVPSQVWAITYEGVIPEAHGQLGSLDDTARLHAPHSRFCEAGVEVGDWVTITAPVDAVAPALRLAIPEVKTGDALCATLPAVYARIEMAVTQVGDRWVDVDLTNVRLRPEEPELDEDGILDEKLTSVSACTSALNDLLLTLTNQADSLQAVEVLEVGQLPARFSWEVRANEAWTVTGSQSGFFHRQRWDTESSACLVDEERDERLQGRLETLELSEDAYTQCPPSLEQIGIENVVALVGDDAPSLTNFSFEVQAFPGCAVSNAGTIETVAPQRDTTWSFNFYGPDAPKTVSAQSVLLGARTGAIDVSRHLVQLDTSGGKAHLLQVRPGIERLLQTFE
jgi:hypothetical protein